MTDFRVGDRVSDGGPVKCDHEAWEEYARSRKGADCGEWLDSTVKPAADYQVGDRVSVEGVVTHVSGSVVGFKPDGSETGGWYFPTDCLTLVERPKRKLRVGSVWECGGMRFVVVDNDSLYRDDPDHEYFGVIPRSELNIDEKPHRWREVPVEELAREVEP